ncbi:hypothetical protein [Celeribacter sp.]|uniref:hypothetical protein n=1 Tax=Celeribacter sp. TaxID=1890673 RepID=UPI003A910B90
MPFFIELTTDARIMFFAMGNGLIAASGTRLTKRAQRALKELSDADLVHLGEIGGGFEISVSELGRNYPRSNLIPASDDPIIWMKEFGSWSMIEPEEKELAHG